VTRTIGLKSAHLCGVAAVEAVREENRQLVAQDLVTVEAEDALSRAVEDDEPLTRVDHHEGIANGLTDSRQVSG
jgi:hypothetical protein